MARIYFYESATLGAACNGDLRALKLAFKNRTVMVGNRMSSLMGFPMGILNNPAGMLGMMDPMMAFIMQMMSRRDSLVYKGDHASIAAGHESREMVQWLHKHGAEEMEAMDNGARINHLDLVKWMHDNRVKGCTTQAMDNAVSGNHLEMVRCLHEHRSERCTTAAMNRAAVKA